MPGIRQVRVLPTDGRWCMWTASGQMEWFADQSTAIRTATLWASAHRPAEAVLEEPGQPPRLLCSYGDSEKAGCDDAVAEAGDRRQQTG